MTIFAVLAMLVGVLVLPVMMAARMVGAGRAGFGSAILAAFLQACLAILTQEFIDAELMAAFIAAIGGSAIFSFVLQTTILRGFAISLFALVIGLVLAVMFAGSLAVIGSAR